MSDDRARDYTISLRAEDTEGGALLDRDRIREEIAKVGGSLRAEPRLVTAIHSPEPGIYWIRTDRLAIAVRCEAEVIENLARSIAEAPVLYRSSNGRNAVVRVAAFDERGDLIEPFREIVIRVRGDAGAEAEGQRLAMEVLDHPLRGVTVVLDEITDADDSAVFVRAFLSILTSLGRDVAPVVGSTWVHDAMPDVAERARAEAIGWLDR